MTDISDLVTLLGGDSHVLAFYDARFGVNGGALVTSWDDARGTTGFGPNWPAVGTTKPAYASSTITLDAVDNGFESAVNTKFDPSLGRTILYVGDFQGSSGWGPAFVDDPLSKYIGFDMRTAVMERSSTVSNISMPTARSSIRRAAMISTSVPAPYGGGGIEPHNVQVIAQVHGRIGRYRQYLLDNQNPLATGSWRLNLGYFGASAAQPAVVRAVIVLDRPIAGAEWAAFTAWAVTNHAAVADTPPSRLMFADGNSLVDGYIYVTAGTGDFPSRIGAATGYTTDFDFANAGVPSVYGQTMALADWQDRRVGPALRQPYNKVLYVAWEITNDIIGLGLTGAQAAENIRLCCVAAKANGADRCIAITCLPRSTFTGPMETARLAANVILRGLPTGIDAVVDAAAITALQNTADTTYYGADGVHLNDTGQATLTDDPTYGVKVVVDAMFAEMDSTATKLEFTTAPVGGPIGGLLSVQPKVTVRQVGDNSIVTSSTRTIVLTLNTVSGGPASLTGTTSLPVTAGEAQFTNVGVTGTAGVFTLTAS
jgi:hypothetical protein